MSNLGLPQTCKLGKVVRLGIHKLEEQIKKYIIIISVIIIITI